MISLLTQWIDILLLTLLCMTAFIIVRTRGLRSVVMLMGIYSLLGASWMLVLDAPDVAFTEAAVGAGISTILALGTLSLTTTRSKRPVHSPILPLAVVLLTGTALVYGTMDMPRFGDPDAPVHNYPVPSYVERTPDDIHVPNVVTAVLASYRGYDTLGETVVILTAGLGVLVLLGRRRSRPREDVDAP